MNRELNDGSYKKNESSSPLKGKRAIHVVDLITEGSSVYRIEDGQPKGWVPMLREAGAKISNLTAVVTRLQGGEKMLAQQGVIVDPFVAIDEDFVQAHSTNPERAVAYMKDPKEWSEAYVREHGALALLPTFDPQAKKLDRAKKFLQRYESVLKDNGAWHELDAAAQERYGTSLEVLAGEK
jgi:hypothetical protein